MVTSTSVTWSETLSKWVATAVRGGRTQLLGLFETFAAATEATEEVL